MSTCEVGAVACIALWRGVPSVASTRGVLGALAAPLVAVALAVAALAVGATAASAQPPASACLAAAVRGPGGTADTDSARRARFRAALVPCMQAMHAAMHAALDADEGDADARFAAAMIPHHQGAVDMARQLLVHGRDPELRAFALGVIAEQQAEIGMLRAWVARHARAARPRPDTAAPRPPNPPRPHVAHDSTHNRSGRSAP